MLIRHKSLFRNLTCTYRKMIAEVFVLALAVSMRIVRRCWMQLCARYSEYSVFVVGCFVSQILGYFLGVIPYAIIDLVKPASAVKLKIQPRRYPSKVELRRTVINLLVNFIGVILPMLLVGGNMLSKFGISSDRAPPSLPVVFTHLCFFLVVEDYANYWLHRALHTPWLYKHIHSVHHENTAPFAIVAAYAHPAETIILALPTFAGPALIAPHLLTVFAWQLLRNYEAIDIHSGYELPFTVKALFPAYAGVDHHDYHHYMHSGNFASIFVWCDRLYGTNLGYDAYKSKRDKYL